MISGVPVSHLSLMLISELPSHGAIIGSRVAADWTALSSFTRQNKRSSHPIIFGNILLILVVKINIFLYLKNKIICIVAFQYHKFTIGAIKTDSSPPLVAVTACLLLSSPCNSITWSSQPRTCQYYR